MPDVNPRCPDCGVTMEREDHLTTDGARIRLRLEESGDGLLGSFTRKTPDVNAHVCPECGLVRWYADVEA
jgi:predicted RNA-binding Zn-ribbon protein involved in translation (DUF1610 family)